MHEGLSGGEREMLSSEPSGNSLVLAAFLIANYIS